MSSSERLGTEADGPLYRLPAGTPSLKAALAEPLAVVLHAFRRLSPEPGSSLLVFGAGAVGILACALARALGFHKACVVDIAVDRVQMALENGWATEGAALPRGERPKTAEERLDQSKETADWIAERFGTQEGFDYVMECSGVEQCIQAAIHVRLQSHCLPCHAEKSRS